jgi:hypothetical protein
MQGRDFMAIQNISGADAMTQGVLEQSLVYNEKASKIEEQQLRQENGATVREEHKGVMIDTRA